MKASFLFFPLCIVLLLLSCQRQKDPEAGLPFITSVSFAGIPAKDLEFDQLRQTITIKVSDLLPEQGLVPTIKTSGVATVTEGLTPEGKLDLTPFCKCFGYSSNPHPGTVETKLTISNENNITDKKQTISYRVVLLPPAAGLIPIEDIPITYSNITTSEYNFIRLVLPVRNLYHNYHVGQISLRNVETGTKHGYQIVGPNCANFCNTPLANRMTLAYNTDIGNKLTSGTYEISILTSWEEGLIVFPQPFIFNR